MKITDLKVHHIACERSPYHWRDEIMPSGKSSGEGFVAPWDCDRPGL